MFTIGADERTERTRSHRENRAWELTRRAFRLGRSIGSLLYLISAGLTATWVIAVFFGVGLFFLMPRPAKLASTPAPEGGNFSAPPAETPWLLQSTSTLDRLSRLPVSRPPEPPRDVAADSVQPNAQPAGQDAVEPNPRSAASEPMPAHAAVTPSEPAPQPEPGVAAAAASEPAQEPAAENEAGSAVGTPSPSQSPHSSPARKRPSRKSASARPAPSHPPTQAIQDVLHKHSHLLK